MNNVMNYFFIHIVNEWVCVYTNTHTHTHTQIYIYIYIRIVCEIQRLYKVVPPNCILFASTMPTDISTEKHIPIRNYDSQR